jgi:hypothetical protein
MFFRILKIFKKNRYVKKCLKYYQIVTKTHSCKLHTINYVVCQ